MEEIRKRGLRINKHTVRHTLYLAIPRAMVRVSLLYPVFSASGGRAMVRVSAAERELSALSGKIGLYNRGG